MFEKRRTQRIRIYAPLYAAIGDARVTMIDISAAGARIEHAFPLHVGLGVMLKLSFDGNVAEVKCTVVRSRLDKSVHRDAIVYLSGLDFAEGAELTAVQDIIEGIVGVDFDARATYAIER
jgi:PilZ domain.